MEEQLQRHRKKVINGLMPEIAKAIVGKEEIVRHIIICLFSGRRRHVLLEGPPGLGKTELAKALTKVIGGTTARIQGTPDLLPSDITGFLVYNQRTGEFETRFGPIFANIVLVDEINRMQPKTQSALLEAMEEGQVTLDKTYPLPKPFMVLATQNPHEYEGTFPLTEVQIDRFAARLRLSYHVAEEEVRIIEKVNYGQEEPEIQQIYSPQEILDITRGIRRSIFCPDNVINYLVGLVQQSRPEQSNVPNIRKLVRVGGSPRAQLAIDAAARVNAFLEGRDMAIPDDVDFVAPPLLDHRIITDLWDDSYSISSLIKEISQAARIGHAGR